VTSGSGLATSSDYFTDSDGERRDQLCEWSVGIILTFSSGTSSLGNSGALYIGSRSSSGGRGGSILLAVGSGSSGSGGEVSIYQADHCLGLGIQVE